MCVGRSAAGGSSWMKKKNLRHMLYPVTWISHCCWEAESLICAFMYWCCPMFPSLCTCTGKCPTSSLLLFASRGYTMPEMAVHAGVCTLFAEMRILSDNITSKSCSHLAYCLHVRCWLHNQDITTDQKQVCMSMHRWQQHFQPPTGRFGG